MAFALGIVGHEAKKFTPETEALARKVMRERTIALGADTIVSGHSPIGGVDWWAEELAAELGLRMIVHAPKRMTWDGPGGYRERNLAIARDSTRVLCVTVQVLPPGFTGMRFAGCYHCRERNPKHVKSGGCWTAWKAASREWAIIVGEERVRA